MISIIIPFKNRIDELSKCLKSISRQADLNQVEILLANDNSDMDPLKKLTIKLNRLNLSVKVVNSRGNGSFAARNEASKYAKGEILAFTDSDCILDPDWCSEIYKTCKDYHGSQGQSNGNKISLISNSIDEDYQDEMKKITSNKFLRRIDTRNFAIRKLVFNQLGGFNSKLINYGDVEFGRRAYIQGTKIVYNPRQLITHIDINDLNSYIKKNEPCR